MSKNKIRLLICLSIAAIVLMAGISWGSSRVPYDETLMIILEKLTGKSFSTSVNIQHAAVVWQLRTPRVLLAFLVGGLLAVSGSVVQSMLKNELASPYTLGVSSGAALGAGIIIILNINLPLVGRFSLPAAGFIGGIITVYGVLIFSKSVDKTLTNNTIILAGMVFSLFINAVLTLLTVFFGGDLKAVTLWQMGSFALKGWKYVEYLIPFAVIGLSGVMCYTRELDLLSFGENDAAAVGVDIYKVKQRLFVLASILTGAAVALSGIIGFIDLIAPHLVRRYFGSKHSVVIPMSFVFGGTFMVAADLAARTLIPKTELPIGAVTAFIGAPFFIYVYFRKGRRAC